MRVPLSTPTHTLRTQMNTGTFTDNLTHRKKVKRRLSSLSRRGSSPLVSPKEKEEVSWSRAKIAWPYMTLYPITSDIMMTKRAVKLRHERVSASSILYRAPEQLVHFDLTKLSKDRDVLTYHDLVSTITEKDAVQIPKSTSQHDRLKHMGSVLRRLVHHSGDISTASCSKAADVFSLSMIAMELLTNRSPWHEIHGIDQVHAKTRLEPRYLHEIRRGVCSGRRPRDDRISHVSTPQDKHVVSVMRRVIKHAWRQRPKDRPSSRKLLTFLSS